MLKRFNFFTNAEVRVHDDHSENCLLNIDKITAIGGGGNCKSLVLGDASGKLRFVNKRYKVHAVVQGHKNHVNLVHQVRKKPIVVSIGNGPWIGTSSGGPTTLDAEIKFWRIDTENQVELVRTVHLGHALAKEKSKPYWVASDGAANFEWPAITCIDVSQDLAQMALGFSDGHVILIRSDPYLDTSTSFISNEKKKTMTLLDEKGHIYTTLQSFQHIGKTKVTGLGFCKNNVDMWLWVATEKNLRSYRTNAVISSTGATGFTSRLKLGPVEPGPELDNEGCAVNCCCVAKPPLSFSENMLSPTISFSAFLQGGQDQQQQEQMLLQQKKKSIKRKVQFVLGKPDRVEYFTPEDPHSVYAVMGEKRYLHWFQKYLVVVTKPPQIGGSENQQQQQQSSTSSERRDVLQLYDFRNKFIATSFTLRGQDIGYVAAITHQWNRLVILTSTKRMFVLKEKDMQTKLDDLFRRNLYATAISLANSSGCPNQQIVEIYKMYGDHLYAKGNFDEAIQQYCRTIGTIEPSYVIRRFLESTRIENLTTYLEALHTNPDFPITGDHTTLLLNCYTKQKSEKKLKQFIGNKNITQHIDVKAAVAVLRSAHYHEHALNLAREHHQHALCLQILLDDMQQFDQALLYVQQLPRSRVQPYLKEYGKPLMSSLPKETTEIIKQFCCAPETWNVDDSVDVDEDEYENHDSSTSSSNAEEYIHIFVDHPRYLQEFLESVVDAGLATTLIWNTYLELLLSQASERNQSDPVKRAEAENMVMAVLKNPGALYDAHHILVLVQSNDFKKGQLFLFEKLGMYHDLLNHYMEIGDSASILAKCKTWGVKDPNLWVQVLMYFAKEKGQNAEREIQEVLHHIERLQILPPLAVIDIISSNPNITLSTIRPYILSQLASSQRLIDEHSSAITHLKKDTDNMKREIQDLRTKPKVFTATKCGLTGAPLELPTVHFLSGNSYNLSSLPGGGSAADAALVATAKSNGPAPSMRLEDPKNIAEQQSVSDIMQKLQENASTVDEEFFNSLEISQDGFATISEYFSKCLFEKQDAEVVVPTVSPMVSSSNNKQQSNPFL